MRKQVWLGFASFKPLCSRLDLSAAKNLLPPQEQSWWSLQTPSRQVEYLAGRALAYELLLFALGDQAYFAKGVKILSPRQKKPFFAFLTPPPGKWHFSISHSKELIGCVLSQCAVGFDLEQLRQPINYYRLAKRYFDPRELALIGDNGSELEHKFFKLWTLKEAYLKKQGQGIWKIGTAPAFNFEQFGLELAAVFRLAVSIEFNYKPQENTPPRRYFAAIYGPDNFNCQLATGFGLPHNEVLSCARVHELPR